nr:SDR family NAD(P)-dependent oxidoreductase [Kouleothrix sp.]
MHPNGKIVLITGASAGIGAATAHAFALAGSRVILAARGAARLQATAEAL